MIPCSSLLVKWKTVRLSVLSSSLQPYRLYPTRFFCPRDCQGKNTEVGSRSIFQGFFLTQELSPGLLHCRQILYHLRHQTGPAVCLVSATAGAGYDAHVHSVVGPRFYEVYIIYAVFNIFISFSLTSSPSNSNTLNMSVCHMDVFIIVCVLCVRVSHSVVSHSLGPYGLQPARLLCPWGSPGKNRGVGCHALLQGSSQPRDRTCISYSSCVSCITDG